MYIKVFEKYGINVSSKRHVDKIIEDLKMNLNDSIIVLDLSGCQTDYPETPRLIDFLLNTLVSFEENKQLYIKFDCLGTHELYILHDLVLEGEFFGIKTKLNKPEDVVVWTQIINDKLKEVKIIMIVDYTTENVRYEYGK